MWHNQLEAKFSSRGKRNTYLLRKLLLSTLLLLHDLGNSSRGLLCFTLFELADFVPVVRMVRIVGIQEIELRVIYFILTNSSFKFWTISGEGKDKFFRWRGIKSSVNVCFFHSNMCWCISSSEENFLSHVEGIYLSLSNSHPRQQPAVPRQVKGICPNLVCNASHWVFKTVKNSRSQAFHNFIWLHANTRWFAGLDNLLDEVYKLLTSPILFALLTSF